MCVKTYECKFGVIKHKYNVKDTEWRLYLPTRYIKVSYVWWVDFSLAKKNIDIFFFEYFGKVLVEKNSSWSSTYIVSNLNENEEYSDIITKCKSKMTQESTGKCEHFWCLIE